MALRIQPLPSGVSRALYPGVFQAIDEVSNDFPDGWVLQLIPASNTTSLEIRLNAQARHLLRDEEQTFEGTKNVLKDLRKSLLA